MSVKVDLGSRSYMIYISESLGDILPKDFGVDKCLVVSDSNVWELYGEKLFGDKQIASFVFEAGEQRKHLDTIKQIYDKLIENNCDRHSTVIALGGGVTGDMAGFAAASYMRGINFVQIPTSLLAQVDSSVGGKVAVDYKNYKNLVGAFYQPKAVYIATDFLKTLPDREFKNGMAEIIKYGFILDKEFLQYVDSQNIDIAYVIEKSCKIKADIVSEDEKESGLRQILNFGHTVGHAVETESNFELSHGECVAIGMVAAFKIAKNMGLVDENQVDYAVNVIKKQGLPVNIPDISIENVYDRMLHDKKTKGGNLTFILPTSIGSVDIFKINDKEKIISVLNEMKVN